MKKSKMLLWGLLAGIISLFAAMILSCAEDQADHTSKLMAEVLSQEEKGNIISIRYEILGVTFLEDLKIETQALYQVVSRGIKKHQLPVSVKLLLNTNNDGSDYSKIEYYFGPTLIYTNDDADGKVLSHVADMYPTKFNWQYRDEAEIKQEKVVEPEVQEKKALEPTRKVEPFKEKRKL